MNKRNRASVTFVGKKGAVPIPLAAAAVAV